MDCTGEVIGCAIEVHKQLGPGLLESTYEKCLMYELHSNNITAHSQVILPICYKNMNIEAGYRLDILLPNELIRELKSVDMAYSCVLSAIVNLYEISSYK
jgi:GxxExxY protein